MAKNSQPWEGEGDYEETDGSSGRRKMLPFLIFSVLNEAVITVNYF